jgi:hypothetical protein
VIHQLYQVSVSVTTIWHYLRKLGLSHQKACHFYSNQDKEEIRLYAQAIINQLVTLKADETMVFMDEFSISTRPSTHYMWGQKGEQPQVPSNEKNRFRTNGFISVDAITAHTMVWQNQQAQSQQVAEFCLRLALEDQKNGITCLHIVLDNNKTHLQKMKTIFETLAQGQHLTIRVSWIHTARYAPKYNLAEYAIAVLRKKALHHLPTDFTIEQVCSKIDSIIENENIMTQQQVFNTIDHILNTAILGNYSCKQL